MTPSRLYWALDSNDNELDPNLRAAQEHAQQEFDANNHQEEYEEPILLRNLFLSKRGVKFARQIAPVQNSVNYRSSGVLTKI